MTCIAVPIVAIASKNITFAQPTVVRNIDRWSAVFTKPLVVLGLNGFTANVQKALSSNFISFTSIDSLVLGSKCRKWPTGMQHTDTVKLINTIEMINTVKETEINFMISRITKNFTQYIH